MAKVPTLYGSGQFDLGSFSLSFLRSCFLLLTRIASLFHFLLTLQVSLGNLGIGGLSLKTTKATAIVRNNHAIARHTSNLSNQALELTFGLPTDMSSAVDLGGRHSMVMGHGDVKDFVCLAKISILTIVKVVPIMSYPCLILKPLSINDDDKLVHQ